MSLDRQSLKTIREKQFGQFSESVEVGLQNYQGQNGVRSLFSLLRSRYGTTAAAKVQLALLFSLIRAQNQPSDLIRTALGEADDGSVTAVELTSAGSGYSGPMPPAVSITSPDAGQQPAVLRAEMEPTGELASIRLVTGGGGYMTAPAVTISPPVGGGTAAQAVATIENARVVSVTLTERGSGYSERDVSALQILFEPPRDEQGVPLTDGVVAEGAGFIDRTVARLLVEDGGHGYSRDQPLQVSIATPQESGGEPSGTAAAAEAVVGSLADLEALGGVGGGPYAGLNPSGSVSAQILKLLPDTLRPLRRPDGSFNFPTASAYSSLLIQPSAAADAAAEARAAAAAAAAAAGAGTSARRFALPELSFGQRDPSFGPLGTSPVQREVSLGAMEYFAFGASGAITTALVRAILVPLDVSKTLMQSNPDDYPDTRTSLTSLWKQGGLPSLYRSWDVTAVGGLFLGGFGFGFNEFLRRYLAGLAGPQAQTLYSLQISIAAALGSVLITCLATCPFEVVRIRAINAMGEDAAGELTQAELDENAGSSSSGSSSNNNEVMGSAPRAQHRDPYSALNGVGTLYAEGGLDLLYSALPPLLLRELPFTVTKFLVYDASTQAIAAAIPSLQEGPYASVLSLLGGLAAGVVAAAVSTPADTLLTLGQQANEGRESVEGEEDGNGEVDSPLNLFRGLLPRCVFFGALIAGQFLLYDDLKRVFKVGPDDILYVLDVFSDRLSFYE